MPSVIIILNAAGGSYVEGETVSSISAAAKNHNIESEILIAKNGEDIDELARYAVTTDAKIIVASGGDGTIGSIAAHLVNTDRILGVLPMGTFNHFSKDLAIPQTIDESLAVIADGYTQMVDVGEVNGRIFINNSSIGLYPSIVKVRDEQMETLGRSKMRAVVSAALQVVKLHSFLRVRIDLDGKIYRRKTPFIFISNNEYQMDLFNIGRRFSLTDGKLSGYLLHKGGRLGVLRLVFKTLFGLLRQGRDFEMVKTERFTIETKKRRPLVAFDGEVARMRSPLEYKILPKALRVIIPRPEVRTDA